MKVHFRVLLGIALAAALFGSAVIIRNAGVGLSDPLRRSEISRRGTAESKPEPLTRRESLPVSTQVPLAPALEGLRERDGSFGYRGSTYCATASPEQVVVALPRHPQKRKRSTLTLSLTEVRLGDTLVAQGGSLAPRLNSKDRAVEYARGKVEERYCFLKEGLEQVFIVRELPEGDGDLVISTAVQTDFMPPQEAAKGKELVFEAPEGGLLKISQAVAIDAAGRKLPLELAYSNSRIDLTVPAFWLSAATLPITVDPLVGGVSVLDANIAYVTERPEDSYCPVTNEWMVTWNNSFGATSEEVYAQRVNAAGTPIGSPTLVSNSNLYDIEPSITYSSTLNRYLVAWLNYPGGSPYLVQGRFINPDGTAFGGVFTIGNPGGDEVSVAADGGGGFMALWRAGAALITSAGSATPVSVGSIGNWPRVAYANNEYMVVWEDNNGIAVRRISTTGTLLTPVTYVQVSEGANANDICGAGDRFLVTWSASTVNSLKGRVVLADGSSSINYGSPEIPLYSPVAYYPASAYSATNGEWYTVHVSGNFLNDLKGNVVTVAGAVTAQPELIASPASVYKPRVSWNSTTNEMLVVYQSTATDPAQLVCRRVAMSGPFATLAGRWTFNEGSGNVAHDSSGAGNDGALTGGISWSPGKSGTAVSLDGSSGFVEVPTTGLPTIGAAESLSWWMNYPSVPSGNQCVIGLTNDQSAAAVQCGFRNGQVTVWGFGGGTFIQALAPSPGVWHHFAYTYSGAIHRFYVDGVEAATSASAPQMASVAKLEFGRWSGGSEYYSGLLDEVRVYVGTLTASEVAALASDASLEAYLRFDEGAGATARDSSGNGHTATLLSGATWSPGRSGTALNLDGSADSVSCVLGSGLPANNSPQTISWWMNYPSVPGSVEAAVCLTNPTANSAVQTGFRNGQVSVWNWGGNTLVSAGAPAGGAWHHFAYTFDGSIHTLFIDGVSVNSSAVAPQTAAPSSFDLGFTPGWQERFQGLLDEVRIYSRALSGPEVATLAQAYSLEAYFKFDEGTGTTAGDSSGNGHTGTFSGGASWMAGKSGSAVNLDGSSGTVSCALGNNLPANNAPQTISWWMNYPAPPQGVQSIIGLTNATAGSAVQCGFRNGQLTIWNWGGNTLVSTTSPAAGSWHQVAYTFDGTTHSLYIDGAPVNSSTASAQTASPSQLDLGLTPVWGEFYAGGLDEVRIYSRALSAAEIAMLAHDPSLAAHYKFDEGTGLLAADNSGNGHSGTLSTGATWSQGVLGTALQLDGSGYVTCVAGSGLPAANTVQSIAWWMKTPSTPSTVQAVVGLTNSLTGSGVQVGYRNGQVTVWNWGGNTLVSATPPTPAVWHHFAYTFDSTTHTLYVDGAAAATSTAAPQTGLPNRLDIGFTPGWGEFFAGSLDDVRIYTRVLDLAEVQGLINSAKPSAPVIVSPSAGSALTQSRPPVSGTSSDSGLQITLLVDGTPIGWATSGAGGAWLIYSATPISDGGHIFTAIATGVAGNSPASAPVAVTIGAASNTQVTVSSASIPDGGYVNNPQPAYSVTLTNPSETGIDPSSIVVHLDGQSVNFSITVVDANTVVISFTPTSALSPGQHVVAIDGNTGTGGILGSVIASFGVDLVPPTFSGMTPANGSFLTNPRPTISIRVSDLGGSGFDPNSMNLAVDGSSIPANQLQMATVDANTVSVTYNPSSNLADGTHTATFQAKDNANNTATPSSTTFTINTSFDVVQDILTYTHNFQVDPPAPDLGIEILSGDAQEGTTGKAAQDPIRVRVFQRSNPATPVANVRVDFVVTSGGGYVNLGPSLHRYTDASGIASAIYIVGQLPGANVIQASVARIDNASGPSPVSFTITGFAPSFTNETTKGLCNPIFSTSDFPGSALSVLFRMKLKDHNGNPMKGEFVAPIIDSWEGTSPTSANVGYFVPSRRVTNAQGEATFAFVIDSGTLPTRNHPNSGEFTLKFVTPQYFDENGIALWKSVSGTVIDPRDQSRDPMIVSGQGQIGSSTQQTEYGLTAVTSSPGGKIIFEIIEGSGGFGDLTVGTNKFPWVACSTDGIIADVDSGGQVGVKFQKANSDDVVLVRVTPASDIFAIGPPEIRYVSASNPAIELPGLQPAMDPASESEKAFLMEFLMPVKFHDPVAGRLESLDRAGNNLTTRTGTGVETINNISMSKVVPNVANRFDRWRSNSAAPFILYDRNTLPASSPPAGGQIALRAISNGAVRPTLVSTFSQEGPTAPAPEIIQDSVINYAEANIHCEYRALPAAPPAPLQWSITTQQGEVVNETPPNATNPMLWMRFTAAAANVGRPGTAAQPVLFNVTGTAQNSLRSTYTLTARVGGQVVATTTLRVSPVSDFGGTRGFGPNPNRPGNTAAGLVAQSQALSNSNGGYYSAGHEPAGADYQAGAFIPLTLQLRNDFSLAAASLDETGAPILNSGLRMVYSGQPPRGATALGYTHNVPSVARAGASFTFQAAGVYGSSVTQLGQQSLNGDDIGAVYLHEQHHVENSLGMDNPNPQAAPPPSIKRDLFMNIMNQFFTAVPAGSQAAAEPFMRNAARPFMVSFDEVQVYNQSMAETAPNTSRVSWFKVGNDLAQFAAQWEQVLNDLENGRTQLIGAAPGAVFQITDTAATNNVKTAIIHRMQDFYDNLPEPYRQMQGGSFTIGGLKEEYTNIKPHILRPD